PAPPPPALIPSGTCPDICAGLSPRRGELRYLLQRTPGRWGRRVSSRNTAGGTMPDLIKHERSREAQAWLKKEIAEQKVRYSKIEHEMNVTIARQRDK